MTKLMLTALTIGLLATLTFAGDTGSTATTTAGTTGSATQSAATYTCSHHADQTSTTEGTCKVCGMKLVKKETPTTTTTTK